MSIRTTDTNRRTVVRTSALRRLASEGARPSPSTIQRVSLETLYREYPGVSLEDILDLQATLDSDQYAHRSVAGAVEEILDQALAELASW